MGGITRTSGAEAFATPVWIGRRETGVMATQPAAAETSVRTPPPGSVPLAVLRPKVGWRLLLPALWGVSMAVMTGWIESEGDDGPSFWGWVLVVVLAGGAVAAWRQRIELHPGVIHRHGILRWSRPLEAVDIEEVTLHYEAGLRDLPHRVLRLDPYGKRPWLEVSFRWWNQWWLVIRWLTSYCTREEDGERVWAVRTDGKTRDRLEPYARPLSAQDVP